MWKSLTKSKDESPYYINIQLLDDKSTRNNDQKNVSLYKVSVTNYVKLWSAVFDSNQIIKIMLDSNKSRRIESDGQNFLKVGLEILNNPKLLHKIEFTESSGVNLDISLTKIRGIVFSMEFTLKLCTAEQFFNDVTRPLLQIIEDQHKSETELRKQIKGIRGYLNKIPKEILMRYEKQDIEDYNDVKHMQTHSVLESVFGNDTEEGVDLRHILNSRPPLKVTLPIKEEADSTDPESSKVSSSNPSLPVSAIKNEPESQPSESTNGISSNLGTNRIKPKKEESNIESEIATSSLNDSPRIKTKEETHLKCESESQLENQGTLPKKRSNELEVKTESNESSLSSSQSESSHLQRHGVLTPKKKRKNLNY